MATGQQWTGCWYSRRAKTQSSGLFLLRPSIAHPKPQPWMWMAWFFGTDFSGTTRTVTLEETVGGGGHSVWG